MCGWMRNAKNLEAVMRENALNIAYRDRSAEQDAFVECLALCHTLDRYQMPPEWDRQYHETVDTMRKALFAYKNTRRV